MASDAPEGPDVRSDTYRLPPTPGSDTQGDTFFPSQTGRFSRPAGHLLPVALAAVLLGGCAGEGVPTDGGGPPVPAASFAEIQRDIFDRSCTSAACHNSSTRAGGLSLATGESYDALVEVEPDNPVARTAGLLRVAPSEAQRSFILRKLRGDLEPGEGEPMPLGLTPLPDESIAMIAGWIEDGAPRDAEDEAAEPVSFGEVQTSVFDRRCTSGACHTAATRAGGLSLVAIDSYDALVNIDADNPSARGAGLLRVKPGSPEESFLLAKLTGDLAAGEGSMMPLGAPSLPEDELDLVRRWIAAGALPD
jgi:hypothetical protein